MGKADRECTQRGADPRSGVAAGLKLWGPEALQTVRVKADSGREGFNSQTGISTTLKRQRMLSKDSMQGIT